MRRYDCCGHCEHDINDPPHDRPCPEGCAEDETGVIDTPGWKPISPDPAGEVFAITLTGTDGAAGQRPAL